MNEEELHREIQEMFKDLETIDTEGLSIYAIYTTEEENEEQ